MAKGFFKAYLSFICFSWIFSYYFLVQNSYATSFIPVSFYKQAEESHGAIHGIFLGEVGKKLTEHEVVTEGSFKVLKISGIKHNDIKNKESFKILYPGGVWEGVGSYVAGTPKFKPGEEVLLLVKKTKHGYIINGLALGKYSFFKEKDGKNYLSSAVFPEHKELGKIDYDEANLIFTNLYGTPLREVSTDKMVEAMVIKDIKNKDIKNKMASHNRGPASTIPTIVDTYNEPHESYDEWGVVWHMIIFIALGCLAVPVLRREKNFKRK